MSDPVNENIGHRRKRISMRIQTRNMFVQVERRSPQHHYRPRNTLDGAKMRASVRMTRYLESWGAAKPFANLHHRDSMTNENGKINTAVCNFFLDMFFLVCQLICSC